MKKLIALLLAALTALSMLPTALAAEHTDKTDVNDASLAEELAEHGQLLAEWEGVSIWLPDDQNEDHFFRFNGSAAEPYCDLFTLWVVNETDRALEIGYTACTLNGYHLVPTYYSTSSEFPANSIQNYRIESDVSEITEANGIEASEVRALVEAAGTVVLNMFILGAHIFEPIAIHFGPEGATIVEAETETLEAVPQELAELTGGFPDSLYTLGRSHDLEALKALYQQWDVASEAILRGLLDAGSAALPDLGVDWESGCIYPYHEDGSRGEDINLALDGTASVSLGGDIRLGELGTEFHILLSSAEAVFYSSYVYDNTADALAHDYSEIRLTLAADRESEHYENVGAYLEYLEEPDHKSFMFMIRSKRKGSEDIEDWLCTFDAETGKIEGRVHIDPSGENIHF